MDHEPLHPCARCAAAQKTCCQRAEILVTSGDRARIAAVAGRDDFVERRVPRDQGYFEFDPADPDWLSLTTGADGSRAVLRRRADGDCTFLGERGCVLDEETRPLVCRIYPFTYNHAGITTEDPDYCPTSMLRPPGGSMAALLEMSRARAEAWRAALYRELRADRAAGAEVSQ
ncbi:MAG: YkgJ family cysteine cluster protein [Planctomycetes bacterium]|nr:YkgJ family cysteine cluster protein [Planctomycetota bacterium]